jgi:hypothetical protein
LFVAPAPSSSIPGAVTIVDCSTPARLESPTIGGLAVGPGSKACQQGTCGINPASSSTWGAIKALYR